MKTHRLKSWPQFFQATISGRKRFEIRKDDRDPPFAPGDIVILEEWDPQTESYSGREAIFFVGYVGRGQCYPDGWAGFELISPEEVNRAALAVQSLGPRGATK